MPANLANPARSTFPLLSPGGAVPNPRGFNLATLKSFAGVNKIVFDEYKMLPAEIQKAAIARERKLEDHFNKLFRAKNNVEQNKEKAHPLTKRILEKDWQISNEELEDTVDFNVAVCWESLVKTINSSIQDFVNKSALKSEAVYSKLTTLENFMNAIQTILLEYHGEMQGVFDQEIMDHHAQVMWHWSKKTKY